MKDQSLSSPKTSTQFFQKLQEQVQNQIINKKENNEIKNKKQKIESFSFKL